MRKLKILLMVCLTIMLGAAAQAQTGGGVNASELSGNYAFSLSGIRGNGSVSAPFAAVGRFTADGAGNLTNGELDANGVGTTFVAQAFTGTYSIGADHRGVMTFTGPGGSLKFAFAMLANGNAHVIEFDATGGAGKIALWAPEKTGTTPYRTARDSSGYAICGARLDPTLNPVPIP